MFRKLLRPFTGTGAIFFPIGTPPNGTCEFSTPTCRKYCYVVEASLFEAECNMPEIVKGEIYNFLLTRPVEIIRRKIVAELDGLQTPILHWFGSGDCPTKDILKISAIIDALPKGVVQMGFTRNMKLWEKYKHIFALTIEDRKFAKGKKGIFSYPDYKKGTSIMYSLGHPVRGGFCGPYICTDRKDKSLGHFVDCRVCLALHLGCFDRKDKSLGEEKGAEDGTRSFSRDNPNALYHPPSR